MLVEVIKNPKIICSEVRAQMMPTTAVVDANPAVDIPKHHPLSVAKAIEKLDIEALHEKGLTVLAKLKDERGVQQLKPKHCMPLCRVL